MGVVRSAEEREGGGERRHGGGEGEGREGTEGGRGRGGAASRGEALPGEACGGCERVGIGDALMGRR